MRSSAIGVKQVLATGSALALALQAGHASAETADDAGAADQTEIVVTGEILYSDQINAVKTPTPIIDVPQSLSIVTEDQIARRGFDSIGQIIDYTPGVNTSQGEGHRDAVVFRGVRSTADFYIDGFRDDVQYYRGLYNLQQVEILRGPNALLFGRGGTGGILNRVTKKGTIGETFGSATASVDTFGAFGFQGDVNFSAGENVAVRLNAMYEHLDNHRDFFDGDRIGINPTVRFQMGESTTLDLSYEYADHERFIDRGIPTGTDGRPVSTLRNVVFADPDNNFTTLKAHLLRANLSHAFSENFKGNFGVFYGDYDKVYSNFYASRYDQAVSPNEVTLDGYIDTTKRENLILSGNLVGEFETGDIGHTLIFGGEYISTSSDQNRLNPVFDTAQADMLATGTDEEVFAITRPLNFRGGMGVLAPSRSLVPGQPRNTTFAFSGLNDDTRVDIDVFSFYIQDEIELTDWLNVVVGGRFDSFEIDVVDVKNGGARSRRKDEEFSPRAGLIIKPQENVSFYASYSESFLPRSGEQFANLGGDNRLAPDTFENLEAGVKWDFDIGLSLTAAAFQIEQSSPEVDDNDASRLVIVDSKIKGFEFQIQGQVTDNWFVSAGYSYLDGEQVNQNGPTGRRPRELPENIFSIWNTIQVSPEFGLGFGLTHQDESFINNGNTAVLPAYTRVDAAAHYDITENLRIQVNIENLTDTVYFPNAHSTHQATVGAPRNARFSITGKF